MADGARLAIPYPEAGHLEVEQDTLDEQNDILAAMLPARPIVLGGCCCSHVGAVQGLATRFDRLAVVWLDAHGDLNTPESSPSGNEWGMPLRMLLDGGVVVSKDVGIIGARNLDQPEIDYVAEAGIDDSLERTLDGVDAAYVALDLDVLDPPEADVFMPEPDGPSASEIEELLRDVADRTTIAGIGVTGFLATERNTAVVARMLAAAGF
jgi:arginase